MEYPFSAMSVDAPTFTKQAESASGTVCILILKLPMNTRSFMTTHGRWLIQLHKSYIKLFFTKLFCDQTASQFVATGSVITSADPVLMNSFLGGHFSLMTNKFISRYMY